MSEPQINSGARRGLILPKPSPLYTSQHRYLAKNAPSHLKRQAFPSGAVGEHVMAHKEEIVKMLKDDGVLDEFFLEFFKINLQAALMIELSTIPLYLYSYYSCKDSSDFAAATILQIVIQEMLHLVLAGNTLVSVGGVPALYLDQNFPIYPWTMLDREPTLELDLRRLDESARQIYIQVEIRSEEEPTSISDHGVLEYQSLGAFYRDLQYMIRLQLVPPDSFQPSLLSTQISDKDAIYRGVKTIDSPDDADKALEIIIDQGEGASAEDKDSHIYKFNHMKPPGAQGTYNVGVNPHTVDYKDTNINAVSNLFDASYCYLLLSIETIWKTQPGAKREGLAKNINMIMHTILSTLAGWLVIRPLKEGSAEHAAPCFDFYDYRDEDKVVRDAHGKLMTLQKGAPDAVRQDPSLTDVWKAFEALTPL